MGKLFNRFNRYRVEQTLKKSAEVGFYFVAF